MWEAIIGLLGNLFAALFPALVTPKSESSYAVKYEEYRFDVARLLTQYGRFFFNPVEMGAIRASGLYDEYLSASEEAKDLGAKLAAFSETLPEKVKDIPINRYQIHRASRCLYGLSNAFQLPHNCNESVNYEKYVEIHTEQARNYEAELRNLLNLHIPEEPKNGTQNLSKKCNR